MLSNSPPRGRLRAIGGTRFAVGAIALATFVVGAAALLFSDRVPRIAARTKDFIVAVGRDFERTFGVDWLDRSSVPGTFDQLGHAALFGSAMVILGLLFRRWVHPIGVATGLVVLSALFEVGQGTLTATRQVEVGDMAANAIGIAIALVVVLGAGLVVDFVVTPLADRVREI